jgi:DUF1365 family protein
MSQARSALYKGLVTHQRFHPRAHKLRYRLFQMLFDLDELPALSSRLKWFSLNRFNLFSFFEADHGDGRRPLRAYVEELLLTAGIDVGGGGIELLCMPRMLGHVFNPISIYYCRRQDGRIAAVLYEVNNTFGERHSYLIPAEGGADDLIRQACDKRFYVSPFMTMAMAYDFALTTPGERIATTVHGDDPEGRRLITAVFTGRRAALTDRALLQAFFAYPLMTLKVVAAIHFEAARIFLKGIGFHARPPKPAQAVTTVMRDKPPVRKAAA